MSDKPSNEVDENNTTAESSAEDSKRRPLVAIRKDLELPRLRDYGGRVLGSWAVCLALIAGIAVFGAIAAQRWLGEPEGTGLGDAPVSVAEDAARNFFTLDYRSLDSDLDRVLASATGDFEAQYREKSADLRKAVEEQELVLTASVPESGTAVEYLTAETAWILVAVDVRTESASEPVSDARYRTRVVLNKSDGKWLVAELQQVG